MSLKTLTFLLITIVVISCQPRAEEPVSIKESSSETIDVLDPLLKAEIDQATKNLYDGISFEVETLPDYNLLISTFTEDARLINYREEEPSISSIHEFVEVFRIIVDGGSITGLQEREIAEKTEIFGNIAHRFSTYETKINGSDTVSEIGINSIQLIRIKGNWKVTSIAWDVEKDNQRLPLRYRP